jgi:hypothetical protein
MTHLCVALRTGSLRRTSSTPRWSLLARLDLNHFSSPSSEED